MHARFEVVGDVMQAITKPTAKNPNKFYGQIKVATGMAVHEFFVEPEDINTGKYLVGQTVKITGNVGRRGFNPQLEHDKIEVIKQAKAA